jgi:hypothetical protein
MFSRLLPVYLLFNITATLYCGFPWWLDCIVILILTITESYTIYPGSILSLIVFVYALVRSISGPYDFFFVLFVIASALMLLFRWFGTFFIILPEFLKNKNS